ncbi:DNA damage-regulated autophagy modulator protein 1-like isoform X1 [Mercenaria mercenaria]|uniref:DNA damage-regulated autophagy modulator protein 1-like isoform X1 n=1 Tax=Mercenaria mercenaria TaxID=6596 RepID=UPI00234EE813|nr:DNA damage-regulated autophagy modulator protein 1-like isoform X1 [Mercenaria mercenaria]
MLETTHHWLPIIITFYVPLSFFITYSIAVENKHVEPGFPYISYTGTTPPESCVFGQLLNIGAVLAGVIIYTRYRQSRFHFEKNQNNENCQNGQNSQNGQNCQNGQNGQNSQNCQNSQNGQNCQNSQNGQNGQNSQNCQNGRNCQNGQNGQNCQNDQNCQNGQNGQNGENGQNRARKCLLHLNTAAFITGSLTIFGVSLAGNFQATNVWEVHLVGAFLAFGVGFVYMILQTIISCMSVSLNIRGNSLCIRVLRIVLCVADFVLFIILGIAARLSISKGPGPGISRLHWSSDEPGYAEHLVATISQWLVAFITLIYFATFYEEFKHFQMTAPQVTPRTPGNSVVPG